MQVHALLPLVTYPDPNSEAVAGNAVAMALVLGAELHALAVNVDIPDISNVLSELLLDLDAMAGRAEKISRQSGEHLLARVKEQAATAGLNVTTETIQAKVALLGEEAAVRARYYDYVLYCWEKGNPTIAATAEALVFGSGRPTILLPELSPIRDLKHVAIAWDGSRVAARAVADAMSVLRSATQVTVLTAAGEKELPQHDVADRLAQGLVRRGLNAQPRTFQADDGPIAESLQGKALEMGADLLVMGAFGHSRIRDFVLGGATAGVISELRIPVLLAH